MKGAGLKCDGQNRNNLLYVLGNSQQRVERGLLKMDERLTLLAARLDALSAILERLEGRMEALHEECQRTAGAAQRTLLRQESLARGIGRIEEALRMGPK